MRVTIRNSLAFRVFRNHGWPAKGYADPYNDRIIVNFDFDAIGQEQVDAAIGPQAGISLRPALGGAPVQEG